VRLFLVPASMASAALAAFISATRLVATLSGVKGSAPFLSSHQSTTTLQG
jgi:hypothetical protein